MRRAQGALEFTLITTAMLLVFAATIIIAEMRFADVQDARFEQGVMDMLDTVEVEIRLAYNAGSGYSREFRIPQTFWGTPYEIGLNPNQTSEAADELWLRLGDKQHFRFVAYPVDGDIGKGMNTITGGDPVVITPS